jgi:hypothetical protein
MILYYDALNSGGIFKTASGQGASLYHVPFKYKIQIKLS